MVGERGGLSYDFGPGPYARPLTEITVGIAGATVTPDRQVLEDPRIPVVTTLLHAGSASVRLTTFALLPPHDTPMPDHPVWSSGRVRRELGLNGCIGWATPPDSIDPAFRNAAWGPNRPIMYRVAVPQRASRLVAIGICEPYKARPGMRSLELLVEGAPARTIDPMLSGIRNTPLVFFFDGNDVDGDGWLRIECHAGGPDPNTFMNAFWVFPAGERITAEGILKGEGSRRAEIVHFCGTELEQNAPGPRADAIVAEFLRPGGVPQIHVKTRRLLAPGGEGTGGTKSSGGPCLTCSVVPGSSPQPYLYTRPRPSSMKRTDDGWVLEFPSNVSRVEVVAVHGNHDTQRMTSIPDVVKELGATRRYWLGRSPVCPILVPDSSIQGILEASYRTVYQVRERVDGGLQFQPGPSVYRGLWIADATLTGIPIAMLGDTASLYRYLECGLRCQLPSGQIRSLYPSVSLVETPAWTFTACWLARATGDLSWLDRHWGEVRRTLDWICTLREQTLNGPPTPYTGLLPTGFVDGGISIPMSDYGTLWWCLVALEEGSRAAERIGDPGSARRWTETLRGFTSSFTAAARRDLLQDRYGNRFLPVGVADTVVTTPQRGQLSIFAPARFASFIDSPGSFADSLATMNLAMMERYTSQGIYLGSGWMDRGVWPWLGGYLGLIHQRIGSRDRAGDILYAYADHATPTGTWVEEQLPRVAGAGTSGDVSDAEASAVFLHLVRYLLVTERKDGVELFGGVPQRWIRSGGAVALKKTLCEYGWLTLELRIDQERATLTVDPIDGHGNAGGPYLNTRALRGAGFTSADGRPLPEFIRWDWRTRFHAEFIRGTSR